LDTLRLDPSNARQHGERNIEAIKGSLTKFGQVEALVVRSGTNQVIGGNGRVVAMRALGWGEADIVEVDVSDTQAIALGIALNRTSELAEWDLPSLSKLLDGLDAEGLLDDAGFNADEFQGVLDDLLKETNIEVNDDDIPAPPDAATSRRGDIWIIGRHRVMNGDSASWKDVEALLAGAPIHCVNVDAPYNVKVEPRSNNAIAAGLSSFTSTHHQGLDVARDPSKARGTTRQMRPKDRPLANDFVTNEEFDRLLDAWFGNAARALLPGRSFYAWAGYANLANFPPMLAKHDLYFSQTIVWDKLHPVLTRKDMMGAFELAFYGWKLGAGHEWFGPNNVSDLWHVKKLNHTAMTHLTEKPVELAARALQYSSRPDENVLDLFGGSGWTAAAAEQVGRNSFSCEIDELYSDVIIARLQKLTGCEARLEATNQTYEEVKVQRAAQNA